MKFSSTNCRSIVSKMCSSISEARAGDNYPPIHANCRCTTVMAGFEPSTRIARDPETGGNYKVDGDMTYNEWVKGLSPEQKQAMKYVDKSVGSGIIKPRNVEMAVNDVHYIGKLNKNIYQCVTKDIQTDDVIITDTQIKHIKERHPNDYERFSEYFEKIIREPDYIIEANKPNSALILKHVDEVNEQFKTVLRLSTYSDNSEIKNSIITFIKIDEKEWNRLTRNKKILYKSE